MDLKQTLKDLQNHIDYSFKNKQNFRKKQNQFADIIFYRIIIIYLATDIIITLIDYFLKNDNLTIPLLSSLLVITGFAVAVYITIEHPFLSYTLLVPLIDIGVAYYIAKSFVQLKLLFLFYIVICVITYVVFVFILQINLLRKITPQLAFIPPIIAIVSQTVIKYKNLLFDLMTNNMSGKVEKMLFNDNYLVIKNKKDFVKKFYEMYSYISVNRTSDIFYNQLSVWISGLTLTFVIGGIFITIRTHYLNARANKKWKELIYSNSVQYKDLRECAYIGGTEYENLILNNPQFLKKIKAAEKNIEKEKGWEDRIRDKKSNLKKDITDYINKLRKIISDK